MAAGAGEPATDTVAGPDTALSEMLRMADRIGGARARAMAAAVAERDAACAAPPPTPHVSHDREVVLDPVQGRALHALEADTHMPYHTAHALLRRAVVVEREVQRLQPLDAALAVDERPVVAAPNALREFLASPQRWLDVPYQDVRVADTAPEVWEHARLFALSLWGDTDAFAWLIRALLALRVTHPPRGPASADAGALAALPAALPVVRLDSSVAQPVMVAAAATGTDHCPAFARALLSLHPAYGLDVSARAPNGVSAVEAACLCPSVDTDVAVPLMRMSSDTALNANGTGKGPILHGLLQMLVDSLDPATIAAVIAELCSERVSRNDGSGYRLFAPRSSDAQSTADAVKDLLRAAGQRLPEPEWPAYLRAAADGVTAALQRVTAYAHGFRAAVTRALAPGPEFGHTGSAHRFPDPLLGIVFDYALHALR